MPIKVSQLTELSVIDGTVVVPVIDNGAITPISKKATILNVANFILQGNAATATALETPRNINGIEFDGSADITVTVPLAPSTISTIGGVIIGTGISVDENGVISVAVLQPASSSVLGGVTIGNGLQTDETGLLSTTVTPAFHGFKVNANGDLEYTKMTSGDFSVVNDMNVEEYVMWEIGTSDYIWQFNEAGLLQMEYTDNGS